ncbi:MAG TPA: hypothetical protein VIK48_05445 [Candidatus Manganitrophaceae bacterium]
MEALFFHFSETHRLLVYSVVFLIVLLLEGEVTLTLAGVLSHRQYLDLYNLIAIGCVAAVLHDALYWSVGVKLAKTHQKKAFFVSVEKITGYLERIKQRYGLYIFLSKYAWGFNKLVLAATGYIGVNFKKLLQYSIPTCLIWASSMALLGYTFSSQTDLLRKDLKTASLLISGFIIAIVLIESLLRRMINRGRV